MVALATKDLMETLLNMSIQNLYPHIHIFKHLKAANSSDRWEGSVQTVNSTKRQSEKISFVYWQVIN